MVSNETSGQNSKLPPLDDAHHSLEEVFTVGEMPSPAGHPYAELANFAGDLFTRAMSAEQELGSQKEWANRILNSMAQPEDEQSTRDTFAAYGVPGYGDTPLNNDDQTPRFFYGPGDAAGKVDFERAMGRGLREALVISEDLWHYRATHDALTDVRNLRGIEEYIEKHGAPLAVLIWDGDEFGEVNKKLGHIRGDMLLIDSSLLIEASVRTNDIVGRFGGDEFLTLVYPDPEESTVANNQRAEEFDVKKIVKGARKRMNSLAHLFLNDPKNKDIKDAGINYGISVDGAAWTGDIVAMIQAASIRMTASKDAKKAAAAKLQTSTTKPSS